MDLSCSEQLLRVFFFLLFEGKKISLKTLNTYIKRLLYFSFLKKLKKDEKTGIISTKFSLRCTPSVILGSWPFDLWTGYLTRDLQPIGWIYLILYITMDFFMSGQIVHIETYGKIALPAVLWDTRKLTVYLAAQINEESIGRYIEG